MSRTWTIHGRRHTDGFVYWQVSNVDAADDEDIEQTVEVCSANDRDAAVAAAHAALQKAWEERDRLAAELAEVMKFADHIGACRQGGGYPCTCGWTAMREKWRGK